MSINTMDHSLYGYFQICILQAVAKMNPDTDMCDYCSHNSHCGKSLAQRPFECNICSRIFKSKDSLRGHKNRYHRDMTNAEKIKQLLEQCLRILVEAERLEEEAQEASPKRPRHEPDDTYGAYHVSSTTTFG